MQSVSNMCDTMIWWNLDYIYIYYYNYNELISIVYVLFMLQWHWPANNPLSEWESLTRCPRNTGHPCLDHIIKLGSWPQAANQWHDGGFYMDAARNLKFQEQTPEPELLPEFSIKPILFGDQHDLNDNCRGKPTFSNYKTGKPQFDRCFETLEAHPTRESVTAERS